MSVYIEADVPCALPVSKKMYFSPDQAIDKIFPEFLLIRAGPAGLLNPGISTSWSLAARPFSSVENTTRVGVGRSSLAFLKTHSNVSL